MSSLSTVKTAREPQVILDAQIAEITAEAQERIEVLSLVFQMCESPLEQVFFLEYISLYGAEPAWVDDTPCFSHTMPTYGERKRQCEVFITPQRHLNCNGKRYRADFLIDVRTFTNSKWKSLDQIVVEIDGHDFHERTKQQAARDRSRDRALTAGGYKVLRFTGSEVYSDPLQTLFELSDFITAACQEGSI